VKVALVLNSDAGTLRGLDPAKVGEEIATVFRARGHSVTVEVAPGKAAVIAIEKSCRSKGADAVVVGGGDGTVSAAAGTAAETGATLGILPLGTMNFFARSLSIPLDVRGAAEALSQAEIAEVDIARINNRWFVHSVALGLHPAMVAEREKMDYGSRYGKMLGSLRAFFRVIRNPRRFSVVIESEHETIARRTAGVVVSNNPLGEGHLPYADSVTDGVLAVYVTTARGWTQLTSVVAAAARGAAADHRLVEMVETRTARIDTGGYSVSVTLDGELLLLRGPLDLECVPRGLKVLMPAKAAA
jgi:diacylglycerol kinase family enzyme